jgi:hypothetical protein
LAVAYIEDAIDRIAGDQVGGGCALLRRMNGYTSAASYQRGRFPPTISGYAVWLYFGFSRRIVQTAST